MKESSSSDDRIVVFSAFAGDYHLIPQKDLHSLIPGMLPLTKKPSNCKKCYSRGYTSKDSSNLTYNICSCVQKVLDLVKIKAIDEAHKLS
jgi:hypothetical protein